MSRRFCLLAFTALCWIVFGSWVLANEAGAQEQPRVLYESEFSTSMLGELPSGMRGGGLERGTAQIVEAPDLPGGKALRIRTKETDVENGQSIYVQSPTFYIDDQDPNVVAIDYHVMWLEGGGSSGQYFYIRDMKLGHYSMILLHSDGSLRWHARLVDPTYSALALAPLSEGWNFVRVVADRTTGLADLYLNDINTPVATELPFQRPIVSWGDIAIRITHETRVDESRDALYGAIRVTALD